MNESLEADMVDMWADAIKMNDREAWATVNDVLHGMRLMVIELHGDMDLFSDLSCLGSIAHIRRLDRIGI